jgi:uncharacterized LabA/DUF88 family protein
LKEDPKEKRTVGIFIDNSNLYLTVKEWMRDERIEGRLDYCRLVSYLANGDEILYLKVYVGEREGVNINGFKKFLTSNSFDVIPKKVKVIYGKSSTIEKLKCDFDVELTNEVTRIVMGSFLPKDHELYAPAPDKFIFITGDSDFAPLLEWIKGMGFEVEAVSTFSGISREIRELLDETDKAPQGYYLIEDIWEEIKKVTEVETELCFS